MEEQKKSRVAGVEAGWKVVGSKDKPIGTVQAVRSDHLVVLQGRYIKHTWYIPIDHVAEVGDGQVKLTIPADDAASEGWAFPPNAGFERDKPAMPDMSRVSRMDIAAANELGNTASSAGTLVDGMNNPSDVPEPAFGSELDGKTPADDEA